MDHGSYGEIRSASGTRQITFYFKKNPKTQNPSISFFRRARITRSKRDTANNKEGSGEEDYPEYYDDDEEDE